MKPYVSQKTQVEIYIGKNAGKRLINKLQAVEKTIRIITPYLDKDSVDYLINLRNKGVDVRLISTDELSDFKETNYFPILKKIIIQERITLDEAKTARIKFFTLFLSMTGLFIIYLIVSGILLSLKITNLFFSTWYVILCWAGLLYLMNKKHKKWRIYEYKYTSLFNGFFAVSPKNMTWEQKKQFVDNSFMHSKIYIIDEKIAFIGSFNFTIAGIERNMESCITIEDPKVILEMVDFFEEVLKTDLLYKNITSYGKLIYTEPIN